MPNLKDQAPIKSYHISLVGKSTEISSLASDFHSLDQQSSERTCNEIGDWIEWAGFVVLSNFLAGSRLEKTLADLSRGVGAYPELEHQVQITSPHQTRELNDIINPTPLITTPDGYIFDLYKPDGLTFFRLLGVIEYSVKQIETVQKLRRLQTLQTLLSTGQTPERVLEFFATAAGPYTNLRPSFIDPLHLFAVSFSKAGFKPIHHTTHPVHNVQINIQLPSTIIKARSQKRSEMARIRARQLLSQS